MTTILNKVPEVGERYRSKLDSRVVKVLKVTVPKGYVTYQSIANGKIFHMAIQIWQRLVELEQVHD